MITWRCGKECFRVTLEIVEDVSLDGEEAKWEAVPVSRSDRDAMLLAAIRESGAVP